MIKCPTCQVQYPENTLFCEECGAYLLRGNQQETNPLTAAEMIWMARKETSEVPEKGVTSPLCLRLTILDSGHDVEVPLTRAKVRIGRLDPSSDSFPDIDLAVYGGVAKGVSRRHAQITRQGNKALIEDMGSINGTFLNRERLVPCLPQVLRDGDELHIGDLMLRVSFK